MNQLSGPSSDKKQGDSYISAVVITSINPVALKDFYSDVFGITFTKDSHGNFPEHYFSSFGRNRLIIHSTKMYPSIKTRQGSVHFALATRSVSSIISRLKDYNCEILNISDEEFGKRVDFRDIDGNFVQAVELNI